ncbi:GL12256 [Drosophila persimilis]|uniref:GL12256 n=1 Tax=Drosophila persimilis TaxID=7234 RepID=B4GMF7_DROPE|nr:GL12256 [Drosophila persimilis]
MSNPISETWPAWLDQQELQSLLKQEMADFRSIQSIRGKWEQNLVRPTYSVQLQIECAGSKKRCLSFLVKSPHMSPSGRRFPIEGDFSMELQMYENILPALEGLYKAEGQDIRFSVPFLRTRKTRCLLLDNAQSRGYSVANTPKGLERPAMEAVLSKLAAYHGGHATLSPSAQKAFQRYVGGTIDPSDTRNSFNVILVGCCLPNNILNSTDAFGHVKDSLFIDFQAAKYGPAAYDLFSLLLTAPASPKSLHFDGYLKFYHDQLIANLGLLKYRGRQPTLTDLQLDLLKYGHWAFEVATEILPLVLSPFGSGDEDVDDDIVELFRNPVYSEQIRELLPWLEDRGYFEEE